MATNGVGARGDVRTPLRRHFLTSGLALRLLLALVVSWLIVMAFFATSVVSH